jgi:hypothetical protein
MHVLLPEGTKEATVTWEGKEIESEIVRVDASTYVDFRGLVEGHADLSISYLK